MNDLMDSNSQEQVLIFLCYIMIGPLFLRQALIAVLAHRLENMRNQVSCYELYISPPLASRNFSTFPLSLVCSKALAANVNRIVSRWKNIRTTALPFQLWVANTHEKTQQNYKRYLASLGDKQAVASKTARRLKNQLLFRSWNKWYPSVKLPSHLVSIADSCAGMRLQSSPWSWGSMQTTYWKSTNTKRSRKSPCYNGFELSVSMLLRPKNLTT